MKIDAPEAVRWITRTLEAAGFETWAVGGAVRDALLGIPSADWDMATRATPKQMRKIFRRTVPVGIEHGTVGILAEDDRMYEVTTFRKDVETDGRHAVVAFSDTIHDDLARRDLTINAIAWHPERGDLFDPYDGAGDLERRVVRTVGDPAERFREDWLRILRAIRFAGRFDFSIEPRTWGALVEGVENLRSLSVERVQEELWKTLRARDPRASLRLWNESGALSVVAPEILDRDGSPDEVLDEVSRLDASRPLLRWVAWIRGGGASADLSTATGLAAATERDARASIATVALMSRLRFSNAKIDRAGRLVAAGSELPETGPGFDEERRRFLARVGPDLLDDLTHLALAAAEDESAAADIRRRAAELRGVVESGAPLSVGDLPFGGRDLIARGHRPGPWFGDLLDALLDRALKDPSIAEAGRLAEAADAWIAEHGAGGR